MAQSMTDAREADNCSMAKVCFAFREGIVRQALKYGA